MNCLRACAFLIFLLFLNARCFACLKAPAPAILELIALILLESLIFVLPDGNYHFGVFVVLEFLNFLIATPVLVFLHFFSFFWSFWEQPPFCCFCGFWILRVFAFLRATTVLVFLRLVNFWAFEFSKGNHRFGVFAVFHFFEFSDSNHRFVVFAVFRFFLAFSEGNHRFGFFLRRLNFWAFGLSKGNRRSGVFAAFDYFNFRNFLRATTVLLFLRFFIFELWNFLGATPVLVFFFAVFELLNFLRATTVLMFLQFLNFWVSWEQPPFWCFCVFWFFQFSIFSICSFTVT